MSIFSGFSVSILTSSRAPTANKKICSNAAFLVKWYFQQNMQKNPNSIKILWQEISWHCSGQEYTLYIKRLMGKARERPEERWAAHLSQCHQPMQQITCKTCRRWSTALFTCQSVLPGITSVTELTVTLHQPPAFCQVSTSSENGKINSPEKFGHFSHEICHIISSFLFWVFSSTNIDSPEQIQLFWLTTGSGRHSLHHQLDI